MSCRWDPVLLLGAGPALLLQLGLLLLGHAPPAAHLVGPLLSSAAVWAWLHYFAPTTALASLVLTGLSFSQEAGRGRELGGAVASLATNCCYRALAIAAILGTAPHIVKADVTA